VILRRHVVRGARRVFGQHTAAVELALYLARDAAERHRLTMAGRDEEEVEVNGAAWLVVAQVGRDRFQLARSLPASA
jgi:hypothetical protein